ncbi:unnamed protein product [Albugo candida]|uniref:CN hydrolase domain-containing protein n=1 Tax=Albugo candida TaxID=65357 RepID=A0A024G7V2_9STRA|nr:unnamed protein product [Albugo candida]|eukprot:CCI42376.1 unnamed protein product [Albugo candida]
MIVLGSGGHTTEMLQLIRKLDTEIYSPITFVVASSDSTSIEKTKLDRHLHPNDQFIVIPRSREVGQSWLTSIWTTLHSLIICFHIIWIQRPDLLLCNGPGTSVPVCVAVKLYHFVGILFNPKILFCSVSSQSSASQKKALDNLSCAFMSKDSTYERVITVAATQMCCALQEENLKKAESLIRIAASRGAQIVLLQELFHFGYFPIETNAAHFQLATTVADSSLIRRMASLAKELRVVLPISFFERHHNSYYNSCAIIDADGSILGTIRKHHISDRLGYNEKYYFSPSDEPFRAFKTRYGRIGVAIGSDQWYPEVARGLVLHGAEILFFTSAMGSSLYDLRNDPRDQWQRVLQGHAAANMVPVIASNRVGTETVDGAQVTFTGSSFITGQTGELLKVADRESEGVLVETFDLEKYHIRRASWGLLRDRRPEIYRSITTRDG